MQHVSESVFRELCLIVGKSQQLAMRRETTDIEEVLMRKIGVDGLSIMLSGSRREGFNLQGSDVDIMAWMNEFRVVMDVSQSVHYDSFNTILLLSVSSESPPGFTLLQLMMPMIPPITMDTFLPCVRMHDSLYLSCSLLKEMFCSIADFFYSTWSLSNCIYR